MVMPLPCLGPYCAEYGLGLACHHDALQGTYSVIGDQLRRVQPPELLSEAGYMLVPTLAGHHTYTKIHYLLDTMKLGSAARTVYR